MNSPRSRRSGSEPDSEEAVNSGTGSSEPADRGVIIRPARRGEMPRIRELIGLFPGRLVQKDLPRIPSFFVAEHRGTIVGCCALQVYSRRLAEVRSLAVRLEYQGQGIAVRLVEACRQRGRRRRVKQLFAVTSEPGFFERRGFTVHAGWKTALFASLDEEA